MRGSVSPAERTPFPGSLTVLLPFASSRRFFRFPFLLSLCVFRRSCKEDKAFDALIQSFVGNPDDFRATERAKSNEWWDKVKREGTFKHIGEAQKKQEVATKGRRATAPRAGKPKKRGRPPKAAEEAAGKRLAPTNRQGARGSAAPRVMAAGGVISANNALGSHKQSRELESKESERMAAQLRERAARMAQEEEVREVLVTLAPASDLRAHPMPKPYLLCKPNLHLWTIKKLIASKYPGQLSADLLHLFLRLPQSEGGEAQLVKCSGEDKIKSYRAHQASGDPRLGVRLVYSLREACVL